MKILFVGQHYWPENFKTTEICESLVAMGHQVEALVGLPNYPTGDIPKEYRLCRNRKQYRNGVYINRCFEIGRKPGKVGLAINYVSYMISATLKIIFKKRDYDVIYAYSTSPVLMSFPAAVASKFFGKKLVIHVLDIWPACLAAMQVKESSKLYRIMTKVSKWIYSQADILLYGSKGFQQYLLNTHGIKVSDEQYLPQFADSLFENSIPTTKTNKEQFNFVFAGNIGKMQAVEVIIKAAALTKDAPITWHIIGDGSHLDTCKALAKTLNVEKNVVFYGQKPVEDMPKYYSMADAMLLTLVNDILVNDTLPAKVQGYMAQQKPILCCAAGESEYVITKAKCGLTAKVEDEKELAKIALEFIKLPPEEIKRMSNNAKEYYTLNFPKALHMKRLEYFLNKQ